MNPSVSIIVPVYNVHKYLDECLNSIEAQTLRDIQIICVNDGSTDSSLDILQRHASKDERIHIIDKPNAGYGHSINQGLSAAKGEYIGIVESDDFIEPDMFETLYARAKQHDLDIARVNYWLYWSTPQPRNEFMECYFPSACDKVFTPKDFQECFFFPPALWSMIVRRSVIEDNNLRLLETPGASFQDTSFSFKLWACAQRAELIHDAYLHYRQDNESSSINNKQKAYYVCEEYAEIERFLKQESDMVALLPIALKRKYDAYLWNMSRISPDLREEFATRIAQEFHAARLDGTLDAAPLASFERATVDRLLESPSRFAASFDPDAERNPSLLRRIVRKILGH